MDFRTRVGRYLSRARSLFANRYFWTGLAALFIVGGVLYVLFNSLVMPGYTRHGAAVTVPDVRQMPLPEAERILTQRDLRVLRDVQRFNPNLPRDVVIDQNPRPNALVKPGRPIYVTVNSGSVPMVTIPPLEGMSLREAMNRLQALGLRIDDARPDSIPSPYQNTVTRQVPAPGDSLPQGAGVMLWYSTGYGQSYVNIPDVTGVPAAEAEEILLEHRLRSLLVGAGDVSDASSAIVARQSRQPGTRVREGFEIRLYLTDAPNYPDEAQEDP
jgi:eukaryotic-like serine/threonine-protein kinase